MFLFSIGEELEGQKGKLKGKIIFLLAYQVKFQQMKVCYFLHVMEMCVLGNDPLSCSRG